MKENRFKVINAIKYKIVADILVAFMFCMCVIGIVGTIQYCVEYDVKEEIYSISGFLFACFICAVLCTFSYQRTDRYLLDVLFWDVQRTGWISGGHVRVESLISGPAQSIIGKKIRVDFDNEKSMDFSLYKRIVQIPEAEKLQIFYLKRSKVVIDIITEGVEQVQLIDEKAEEMPFRFHEMSRNEIWNILKLHHKYPICNIVMMIVLGMGILGFIIYARVNYVYWFIRYPNRFIWVLAVLVIIYLVLLILYLKKYKGYLTDMLFCKVLVTGQIPYDSAVCVRYAAAQNGKVIAVGIRTDIEKYRGDSFVLYNNVSKYWNCFSMDLERFYKGVKYQSGNYEFQTVRFYYLKNSKLVVGVEVIENGRKKK